MVPKGIEKLSTGIRVCVCECVLARSLTLMDGGGKKKKKKKQEKETSGCAATDDDDDVNFLQLFYTSDYKISIKLVLCYSNDDSRKKQQ